MQLKSYDELNAEQQFAYKMGYAAGKLASQEQTPDTFPSEYEWALLDRWLQGLLGTDKDYEARLVLAMLSNGT